VILLTYQELVLRHMTGTRLVLRLG
jgi:hypothetical protein